MEHAHITITQLEACYINCGNCGADVESPTGSLIWIPEDFSKNNRTHIPQECSSCGYRLVYPVTVFKTKQAISKLAEDWNLK